MVLGLGLLGAVLSAVFGSALSSLQEFEPVGPAYFLVLSPFALSGGYLAWRRPSNAVGWWLLTAAFFWIATSVGATYGVAGLATEHGPLPGDEIVYLASAGMWAPGLLAIGMVIFLFPTGRPLSSRWNWMVPTAVSLTVVVYVAVSLLPDILQDAGAPNPIAWTEAEDWLSLVESVAGFAQFGLGVAAVVSLILRYTRSDSVGRQQIKWLMFPVVVAIVVAVLGSLRDLLGWRTISAAIDVLQVGGLLAVALIPVAITVAVMRYGLYDLGRIVNRTVVYGLLAVLLGLVYSGSVLLLTAILPGSDNPLGVAMSTLAAAVLFNPIRRRVQGFVDRRLYRQSYDPDRMKEEFQERLRESVHPETVARHLVEAANDALKPEMLGIWIRT